MGQVHWSTSRFWHTCGNMTFDPPTAMVPYLPEMAEQLRAAAKEDDHTAIAPTHVFIKDNEIVGYCRVDVTCHWWLHTEKCKVRDTLACAYQMEAVMRDRGISNYVMLCAQKSPYSKIMEKGGFSNIGSTQLYQRTI